MKNIKNQFIARSSEFANNACNELLNSCLHQFCVNAACSIELLGKGVLANLSPSLIIKDDFNSLLKVLGLEKYLSDKKSKIRTISGKETINRCMTILKEIKKEKENLFMLFDIRNGTIHFGEDLKEIKSKLVKSFLSFIESSIEYLDIKLEEIIKEKKYVELLRHETQIAKSEIEKVVKRKILAAKKVFKEKYGNLPKKEMIRISKYFPRKYYPWSDIEMEWECPACSFKGELACTEERSEPEFDEEELVSYYYITLYPVSFICPFCNLEIEGEDELYEAGFPDEIDGGTEEVDEPDYEPEY